MILTIVLLLNIALLALIFMISNQRFKNFKSELASAKSARQVAEEKYANFRQELTSLKEEHSKKNKQLEELREISKRRLKKDAQRQDMTETETMTQTTPAMPSFDLALKTLQQQADEAHQEELAKQKAYYQERIAKLEAQIGQRKQNAEKSKKSLEGNVLTQVESLSEDAVLEMGRLLRKAEHAEKLLGATRGKLQMSQERFSEMQKRYFGVCRELALASGQALAISDEEIRNQAEDLVAVTEQGVAG
ncbi:MAG: hypothetical protein WCK49_09645 [Myxococcaceae bacterium]